MPVNSFANDGKLDLKTGIDRAPFPLASRTPGRIFENILILGSATGEGYLAPPGDVRAFDVITGKLLWVFHTIPRPGEFGYDTWPKDAYKYMGGVDVWGEITLDEKRGIVYLPTASAKYELYGGDRKGDNLFADCLLALDARTGKYLWHYQTVHHDVWDYDPNAAPQLVTVKHEGKTVDAVALASKNGFLFVFERVTGKPLWPIEERPVPQSDVPGEKTSSTQPFPTKPPAYSRNGVLESDLVDFTPDIKAQALEVAKRYRLGPVFLPPLVSKPEGPLAALTNGTLSGGVNWPGSAYDPEMHAFFTHACNSCIAPLGLVAPPKDFSDLDYVMGTAGATFRAIEGGGVGEAADSPRPQRAATPPPPPTPPPAAAGGGRAGAPPAGGG